MIRAASLTLFLLAARPILAQQQLVPFEDSGRWGYRDGGGKIAVAPRFTIARPFGTGGIAAVVDSQGWAYIDARGRVLVRPLVVDNGPDYFSEGLARFRSNGKFGFFDESGKIAIPARFDFVLPFAHGLAAFCSGCVEELEGEHTAFRRGVWGYIGKAGQTAIPPRFEAAGDFSNGQARVQVNGKWTTIDRTGKPVN